MSTALNVYKSKLGEIPNWGFTYQVFYIKTRGPGATLLIWVTKAITNQKRFDHLYSIKYKISTQFSITSPLKGTWINFPRDVLCEILLKLPSSFGDEDEKCTKTMPKTTSEMITWAFSLRWDIKLIASHNSY